MFRALCLAPLLLAAAHGETGRDAWLRYAPLPNTATAANNVPAVVSVLAASPLAVTARNELVRGLKGLFGRTTRAQSGLPSENAIVLGLLPAWQQAAPRIVVTGNLPADSYWLKTVTAGRIRYTAIAASNERGLLYGAFALLRKLATGQRFGAFDERAAPYAPVRWVNQWDNLDGSIERGYGGRSIFWESGHARADLSRVGEYGRLLASVGINGCAIDNVNADPRLLTPALLPDIARIAAALRPWGVRVALSVDLGSPKTIGGLDTFDPLDNRVVVWWRAKADELYSAVPDLAGLVMKADSEGRVGPSAYGRTHADAANVVARALQPHGGIIFYRGFVYDHHMDWRNPKNDRARAAYDNFVPLDGQFDSNAVVQIKNGPIDFQVREPVSPLIGALERTNQALELQITQEYTGQARHLVFLAPMWKEVLDFDLHANGASTPVKALAAGKVFKRPLGGFIGVANAGLDENWFGNQLSQANLYGFGRLAWNPDLSASQIAEEWTRLTFGNDGRVVSTVDSMLLSSWRTYENYTGPLGLQTLTDITGNHYGVSVEASERNGWGQWHRADARGVGMDRTLATGTGYAGQYRPAVARVFESLGSTPDDLVLFFHHVPYTQILHDGKTVIQYLYDSHYAGAAAVEGYVSLWKSLRGLIDDERYREILAQLRYQAGQAELWRDAVTRWFLRASGIPDNRGRVGHYPGRVEAEGMRLSGYVVQAVTPWEAASGGKAVVCPAPSCSASYEFHGPPGWYTVRVRYFDTNTGVSHFRLRAGAQLLDQWDAGDHLPTRKVDSSSSERRDAGVIALRPGDEIEIEGLPGGQGTAALDYIEVLPLAPIMRAEGSGMSPPRRQSSGSSSHRRP